MTRPNLILMAILGSVGLLAAAFAFEHFAGLAPCVLCWYQRYPHMLAVAIGLIALRTRHRPPIYLGLAAVMASAVIGVFHFGVETGWWAGLQQCSVDTLSGVSAADLLNTDITVGAPASCGKVAWSLFGISMAGWNVIASAGLAGVWALAARKDA